MCDGRFACLAAAPYRISTTSGDSNADERDHLSADGPDHLRTAGAERHPEANLPGSAGHGERHHRMKAEAG